MCTVFIFGVEWMQIPHPNPRRLLIFFRLQFFGMEIPRVNIDPVEFFHVVFKRMVMFILDAVSVPKMTMTAMARISPVELGLNRAESFGKKRRYFWCNRRE